MTETKKLLTRHSKVLEILIIKSHHLHLLQSLLTQVESTEPPVLQLPQEISWTNTLCEVELSLPVQTQNILEYLGRPVKIEFACGEIVGITQGRDLSCGVSVVISPSETPRSLSHLHRLRSAASVICFEETCRWSPT